jgi:hypothetical protein
MLPGKTTHPFQLSNYVARLICIVAYTAHFVVLLNDLIQTPGEKNHLCAVSTGDVAYTGKA